VEWKHINPHRVCSIQTGCQWPIEYSQPMCHLRLPASRHVRSRVPPHHGVGWAAGMRALSEWHVVSLDGAADASRHVAILWHYSSGI